MKNLLLAAFAVAILGACSSPKTAENTATLRGIGTTAMIPKAIAYKTSGNYTDNVPVNINPSTGKLTSFPAPADVNPATSAPVQLNDGWLLDRRGVGQNTVFTTYTYEQYHSLTAVPDNLLDCVIPGSKVTEIIRFPAKINEITPEMANRFIATGDYITILPAGPRPAPLSPEH